MFSTMLATAVERIESATGSDPVPGFSVAVRHGNEWAARAAGVANLRTGLPATTDTRFQIGSVTKPMVATLALRAADLGWIGLADTVADHLPWVSLPEGLHKQVTVAMLLSHTSGIPGDVFDDHGHGVDAARRYIEALAVRVPLHRPGAMFSYCNAGYVVLGELLSAAVGRPLHRLMREELFDLLELPDVCLFAEEAILGPVAVGHAVDGNGHIDVVPAFSLPHCLGAAGSWVMMTGSELVRFGSLFIDGGSAIDGRSVLSPEAMAAMLVPQIDIPDVAGAKSMGLGMPVTRTAGPDLLQHTGATLGQHALLRVVPEHDLVIAVLTNGPGGAGVSRSLADAILQDLRIIVDTPATAAPIPPVDCRELAGRYDGPALTWRIDVTDDALVAIPVPHRVDEDPPTDGMFLRPAGGRDFLTPRGDIVRFTIQDGQAWMCIGGRQHHRQEPRRSPLDIRAAATHS